MGDDQTRIEALEARVADLEAAVEALTSADATPRRLSSLATPPPPAPGAPAVAMGTQPPPPTADAGPPPERDPFNGLDSETVLKWGGVGLVVLAVGFAVSTAIQRGWISPLLQLFGAIAVSLALIGAGLRLRSTRLPWTHALCAGGVAALFATFASDLFLDEVNADTAYVLTFLVGLGGIALARFVPSEWVAAVAAVGGAIGWLVIGDGTPPFIETGAVFLVVFCVVVIVAVEQEWFAVRLVIAGIGVLSVMGFAVEASTTNEEIATLVAGAIVAAALFVVPSLGPLESPWRQLELRAPMVLALVAWFVIAVMYIDDDEVAGYAGLMVAAAVVAITMVVWDRLLLPHGAALLVGASVTFTAGIGLVLGTETAWVAVAVQGVGLLLVARALQGNWLLNANAVVLLFAAGIFAAGDGAEAWMEDTTAGADIARLAIIVAVAVGIWLSAQVDIQRWGALVVLALVMTWLGSVLVHVPQGQAAVSLSWAVIGVALLVVGATRKLPEVGQLGLGVLAITVAKLLLVDMAEVDALWRAGLFFIVGLALMRLGFLLPHWTGAGESEPDGEPAAESIVS